MYDASAGLGRYTFCEAVWVDRLRAGIPPMAVLSYARRGMRHTLTAMKVVRIADRGVKPLHDVAFMLRDLADRVEAGEFGDTKSPDLVLRLICVVRASSMEPVVIGFGSTADPNQAFVDLHAGAQQLLHMNGER